MVGHYVQCYPKNTTVREDLHSFSINEDIRSPDRPLPQQYKPLRRAFHCSCPGTPFRVHRISIGDPESQQYPSRCPRKRQMPVDQEKNQQ